MSNSNSKSFTFGAFCKSVVTNTVSISKKTKAETLKAAKQAKAASVAAKAEFLAGYNSK